MDIHSQSSCFFHDNLKLSWLMFSIFHVASFYSPKSFAISFTHIFLTLSMFYWLLASRFLPTQLLSIVFSCLSTSCVSPFSISIALSRHPSWTRDTSCAFSAFWLKITEIIPKSFVIAVQHCSANTSLRLLHHNYARSLASAYSRYLNDTTPRPFLSTQSQPVPPRAT